MKYGANQHLTCVQFNYLVGAVLSTQLHWDSHSPTYHRLEGAKSTETNQSNEHSVLVVVGVTSGLVLQTLDDNQQLHSSCRHRSDEGRKLTERTVADQEMEECDGKWTSQGSTLPNSPANAGSLTPYENTRKSSKPVPRCDQNVRDPLLSFPITVPSSTSSSEMTTGVDTVELGVD